MKKKAYWDEVTPECYLVYAWNKRWNRYVCTNKFENKRDAAQTVGEANAKNRN